MSRPSPNVVVWGTVLLVLFPLGCVFTLIALGRDTAQLVTFIGIIVPSAVLAFLALLKADKVDTKVDVVEHKVDNHVETLDRVNVLADQLEQDHKGDIKEQR